MDSIALREMFPLGPKWGPIGHEVYSRTFSRPQADGSREDWAASIERTVLGNIGLVPKRYIEKGEADKLMELFFQFYSLPAGRHLWTSGVPGRQFLFNCHHAGWTANLADHASFTFDELMKGGGTGTNFSNRYISAMPKVTSTIDLHVVCNPDHRDYSKFKHRLSNKFSYEFLGAERIEDSREGWVRALELVIATAFGHRSGPLVLDISLIRPAGEPIKGFGGTASGPGSLVELLIEYSSRLNSHVGQKLTTMPLMYLEHSIAECVIAGNVRRSARMSIKHWADQDIMEFINCKQIDKELWSTNISVEYDSEFIRQVKKGGKHANAVLDAVIQGMLTNGEPGLWNYTLSQKGEVDEVSCTNPCFSPETLIPTDSGIFPIESLVGKSVKVLSGGSWVTIDNFRVTGENQKMLKIGLQDGSYLRVTPYHSMILENGVRKEAKDLLIDDTLKISLAVSHGTVSADGAYLKGFLIGDGTQRRGTPLLWLYSTKESCMDRLVKSAREIQNSKVNTNAIEDLGFRPAGDNRLLMTGLTPKKDGLIDWCLSYKETFPLETFSWDLKSKTEFVAGVLDADGGAMDTRHGFGYQIWSISRPWLEGFQTLLKSLGVLSKLSGGKEAGRVDFEDGYGEYDTKCSYRLTVSQAASIRLSQLVKFERLISFSGKSTRYELKPRFNRVVSIAEDGVEDKVYCCTVPETHSITTAVGIETGQCGEIPLVPFENCNLGHVNLGMYYNKHAKAFDSFRLMARYLVRATFGDVTNPVQRKIVDRNRRTGVGFFGYQDFCVKQGIKYSESYTNQDIRNFLQEAYRTVRKASDEYAFQLRIPAPIKCTTVAPTGTIAKLAGVSEGLQTIMFRYGKRRMNLSTIDPTQRAQLEEFKLKGYFVEPSVYSANTEVVQFIYKDKLVEEVEALGYDAANLVESAYEVSVQDYLGVQSMIQDLYADNAISMTINLPDNTGGLEIRAKEFKATLVHYLHRIKGVTAMPAVSRAQMPYEEATRVEYLKANGLAEVGQGAMECANGACPIK